MPDSSTDELLSDLRAHLREIAFVGLHKYVMGVWRYGLAHRGGEAPWGVPDIAEIAGWLDGDVDSVRLAVCLMAGVPVAPLALPARHRALAERLRAGGLLELREGDLVPAGLRLTTLCGLPILVRAGEGLPLFAMQLAYYGDGDPAPLEGPALAAGRGAFVAGLLLSGLTDRVRVVAEDPDEVALAAVNAELTARTDRMTVEPGRALDALASARGHGAVVLLAPLLVCPAEGAVRPGCPGLESRELLEALLDRFDDLVRPGGSAWFGAEMAGGAEEPHVAELLRERAAAQSLRIDIYIDERVDHGGRNAPVGLLAAGLRRSHTRLRPDVVLRWAAALSRVTRPAECVHSAALHVRRADDRQRGAGVRVFNRYASIPISPGRPAPGGG